MWIVATYAFPVYGTVFVFVMNKHIKMNYFKSCENFQENEGGPDRSVSDNQSSSVILNELAMKARKNTEIPRFSKKIVR